MLFAVPCPAAAVVMAEGRDFYLIFVAADGAAAKFESLFGAGRLGDDLYVLEVLGAGKVIPLGIKPYFKSAVFGKLSVEHIEIAGFIAVAGAVGLGVPADELPLAAGGLRGLNLCNIAVVCLVVIVGVVGGAALAAVCIVIKHIAGAADVEGIACFGSYGRIGNNYVGTVGKSYGDNKLIYAGSGNIVVL